MSFVEGMLGFVFGAAGITLITIIVLWWIRKKREEEKPIVFILELDTLRFYLMGRFKRYVENLHIEVQGEEKYKRFWGVRTDGAFILPATGAKEDIVVQDPGYPGIILLLASVIGFGYQRNAHETWVKEAFPDDIYENPPKLMKVPENYVFVTAYGKRSWIKTKYKTLRPIFSQVNRISTQYERQLEMVHAGYAKFITARIQGWNEILTSQWETLLEGWDTTKRNTIVPLEVLCRLLHIPISKVVYSGLSHTLGHGGMRQQAQFAQGIRHGVNELNKSLGLTAVEAPLLEATSRKMGELQERVLQSEQKATMYQNAFNRFLQQVSPQSLPQVPVAPPAPPLPQSSSSPESEYEEV